MFSQYHRLKLLPTLFTLLAAVPLLGTSQAPTRTSIQNASSTLPRVTTPRLYVVDCGQLVYNRPEYYNLTRDEVLDTNMPVTCYLVIHPKGILLFDTGLEDQIVGEPIWQNIVAPFGQLKLTTLRGELAAIGIQPSDISYLALSHSHFDHTGNADMFPDALWLTPKAEYEFMFHLPENLKSFNHPYEYENLRKQRKQVFEGDHDVFGDGTVVLLQTPGHTPGHQSLYVKLAKTGGVVLAGDLYHYHEERSMDRMPDPEKTTGTPASRRRIEDFLIKTHSQLWIGHSTEFYKHALKSPAWYE